MPNLGPGELIVILLVALVVFGPRKLPELGKSLGAGLREFRRSTQSLKDDLEGGLRDTTPPGAAPVQTIHTPQAVAVPAAQAAAPTSGVPPVPAPPAAVQASAVVPQPVAPAPTVSVVKENTPG
ncbi:twin-arginine translocase TatA/TatE family subunit [Deinococcus depolymerans]|uniref:Sec-independent protein translocase protein TatA n=1 Tax=Deinococcus depolymerans TaxID=392408 RepID=A0ABP3LU68_9DEIO